MLLNPFPFLLESRVVYLQSSRLSSCLRDLQLYRQSTCFYADVSLIIFLASFLSIFFFSNLILWKDRVLPSSSQMLLMANRVAPFVPTLEQLWIRLTNGFLPVPQHTPPVVRAAIRTSSQ